MLRPLLIAGIEQYLDQRIHFAHKGVTTDASDERMLADLNVIDFDRLKLRAPQVAYDLPAGGRRLIQRADGYRATIVAGEVTYRDGEPTDALPGRLLRGARGQPAAMAAE